MKETMKEAVKRVLEASVAKNYVAGASLLVLQDGKELLFEQAGFRDRENQIGFDRDTICRLYSMSKPVTAVAVMILMERGLIDLADPVSMYLPAYAGMQVFEEGKLVPVKRDIMIKELLCMTSGCVYPGMGTDAEKEMAKLFEKIDQKLYTEEQMTTMEIVNAIGGCPLDFQPGAHWKYGTGADILGGIVETVSGMKFSEFLKKEIFEPLEMKDTGFYVPEEKQSRLAKVYDVVEGELQEFKTNHLGIRYTQKGAPAFESGGAGLVSTLDDYAKFAQMLMNRGEYQGKRLLQQATVEYLTHTELMPWQQVDLDTGWESMTGYTYGNLLRVMKWPERSYMMNSKGEYGWDGWLGPYFCNAPEEKLTFLFFMQKINAGTNQLTRQLRNVVYSKLGESDT